MPYHVRRTRAIAESLERRALLSGNVSGHIWQDTNLNEVQDAGEVNRSGLRVFLSDHGTMPEPGDPFVYTDINGNFAFNNVPNGTYGLALALDNGLRIFSPNSGNYVLTVANGNVTGQDFGIYMLTGASTFSGTVFDDANSDGSQDNGESGLPSQGIYADLNDNGLIDPGEPTATTAFNGSFTFVNLGDGTYIFRPIVYPDQQITSPPKKSISFAPSNGSTNSTGNRFGVHTGVAGISISGYVYEDFNSNHNFDTAELPARNVSLYLDANSNGKLDAGEQRTLSRDDGTYAFENLAAGTYIVRLNLSSSQVNTAPSDALTVQVSDQSSSVGNRFYIKTTLPTSYVLNDFNYDGKADMVAQDEGSGIVTVWFMDGAKVIDTSTLPTPGADWKLSATGDFNVDGRTDLVFRSKTGPSSFIWTLNGTSGESVYSLADVGDTNWTIVGAYDMDGDGSPDLIWRNTSTFTTTIWYMRLYILQPSGPKFGVLPKVSNADWVIENVGDYNHDGKGDLFWSNTATRTNSLWLMNDTSISAFRGVRYPTTGWSLFNVSDFNNDHEPDLLWIKTTGGSIVNSLWLLGNPATAPLPVAFSTLILRGDISLVTAGT